MYPTIYLGLMFGENDQSGSSHAMLLREIVNVLFWATIFSSRARTGGDLGQYSPCESSQLSIWFKTSWLKLSTVQDVTQNGIDLEICSLTPTQYMGCGVILYMCVRHTVCLPDRHCGDLLDQMAVQYY